MIDFARLQAPFPAHAIQWRVARSGKGDGGIWARVVPYIDTRSIQERLDEVCTPTGWRTEEPTREGDLLMVGLSLLTDSGWVTKWDGTGLKASSGGPRGLSAEDATKGTFTTGFRRVTSQWGVGRYVYHLGEMAAKVSDRGRFRARLQEKQGGDWFRWDPPELPAWALPGGSGAPAPGDAGRRDETPTGTAGNGARPASRKGGGQDAPIKCPRCGSACYDNRQNKPANRANSPDIRCKDTRGCGWGVKMPEWETQLLKGIEAAQRADKVKPGGAARAVAEASSKDPARMLSVHTWLETLDGVKADA